MVYDVVIVGAGSAGAILATRLTEDPGCSVLLIEAGPDYPDLANLPNEVRYGHGPNRELVRSPVSSHRWTFVARYTDRAAPGLVPRGRVTGGSSAVNAQIFLRGVPDDYDRWAAQGNDRWSFEGLLPYFRRIESDRDFGGDFHGAEGPIPVRRFPRHEWNSDQGAFYDACRAAGFGACPDHNEPDSTGVGPTPLNNIEGVRWSTAIGYLDEARGRDNLTISADSLVRRVLFDGGRAVGVELERARQTFAEYGGEIVLSAGAIGSPHILMLSGMGPADHLRSAGVKAIYDLPGVGQNLRDHPLAKLIWRTKAGFRQDIDAARIQVTLRYTSTGSHLYNDMLIHPTSHWVLDRNWRGHEADARVGIMMVVCLDLALGSGHMRLRSDDPRIQPFLDYNYLEEPFDRRRLREGVRKARDLGGHPDWASLVDELIDPTQADLESEEALDAWLRRSVETSHHVSGTCKMGPGSDPTAVVDQYGRVHGVEGLRVADASLMPDCTRANTNATTMVIGERIADFMRGQM